MSASYAEIQYPNVDLRPAARERAEFLVFGYYTEKYGPHIRFESCRSLRQRIQELESSMQAYQKTQPALYSTLARQRIDFERLCALQELIR